MVTVHAHNHYHLYHGKGRFILYEGGACTSFSIRFAGEEGNTLDQCLPESRFAVAYCYMGGGGVVWVGSSPPGRQRPANAAQKCNMIQKHGEFR